MFRRCVFISALSARDMTLQIKLIYTGRKAVLIIMKNENNIHFTSSETEQIALKVSRISILWNIILTVFKMFAGIFAHSGAMISDALHSASDVFSTLVVMAGVRMANKDSDKEHPYGHERIECVAAILLAVLLAFTGFGIGYSGILKIFSGKSNELQVPGILALIAAVISILVKEIMYRYTIFYAKQINSGAMTADAWHHRSDALSSIGSFAGILGAKLGFPIFDPIASVIICIFIIKASFDIFKDSVNKLMDTSCDDTKINEIIEIINSQDGVLGIDMVKTRLFGDKIYVDIEICADGNKTLNETHKIAEQVHDAIENQLPNVKHCMVHVNPYNAEA